MRISQLAARSGAPATALRFYDGAGLLPADRSPVGYRCTPRTRSSDWRSSVPPDTSACRCRRSLSCSGGGRPGIGGAIS
ncbi:MerR family DNA-binding transcriptional regulator [Streptomyces sp. NPDC015242]|uniref:MerR family DNA-binding transcriptional regulator n=1 Tax=Streptomyces sp. NPDC015242 TaxID=3364951 RepID=UPI0036F88CA5